MFSSFLLFRQTPTKSRGYF